MWKPEKVMVMNRSKSKRSDVFNDETGLPTSAENVQLSRS